MPSDSTDPPHVPPSALSDTSDVPVVDVGSEQSDSTQPSFERFDGPTLPEGVWRRYFPFKDAYPEQVDGINRTINALSNHGYLGLEGACGTGKTLIALVAAITALRERTAVTEAVENCPELSHIVAATPLKSQLSQFVTEVKTINTQLPADTAPLSGLVLRGKADLLPYTVADAIPDDVDDGSAHEVMDGISQRSRQLLSPGGLPIYNTPRTAPVTGPPYDDDADPDQWFTSGDHADKLPSSLENTDATPAHIAPTGEYLTAAGDVIVESLRETPITASIDPRRANAVLTTLNDAFDVASPPDRLTVDDVETPHPQTMPSAANFIDIYRLASRSENTNPGAIETEIRHNYEDACDDDDITTPVASFTDLPLYYHVDYLDDNTVSELLPDRVRGYIDPFYVKAQMLTEQRRRHVSASDAHDGVFTRDALIEAAASKGSCPYRALVDTATNAPIDIFLGNYYHVFDPTTRRLTKTKADIISSDAALILDEAHQIVNRVRDIFSHSVGFETLKTAAGDIDALEDLVEDDDSAVSIEDYTGHADATRPPESVNAGNLPELSATDLQNIRAFISKLQHELTNTATEKLSDDEYLSQWPDWSECGDEELPLESPQDAEFDEVSRALTDSSLNLPDIDTCISLCQAVNTIHSEVPASARTTTIDAVADLLENWIEQDHTTYFRYIELEANNRRSSPTDAPPWMRLWEPRFKLYNTLPARRIADTLQEFAGGIAMSATLTPLPIFTRTTGFDIFAETEKREVTTVQYPLSFPQENRDSYVVPLDPFTHRNRGKPREYRTAMTNTRKEYADAITTIAQSHGNVLLALPKYDEADWAHTVLTNSDSVEKPIVRDRSSSATVTDKILTEFFRGEDKVLVTSARGTITEGIDYDGDKLHTAAIIGVPYLPTHKPSTKAMMTAYEKTFTDVQYDGYELVIGVPTLRKVRQAIGRVVRSEDERGLRLLVDSRYESGSYNSVANHLSTQEQSEFRSVSLNRLPDALATFWNDNV